MTTDDIDERGDVDGVLAEPDLRPLLLPWIAEHAPADRLAHVAGATAAVAELDSGNGWPVIADAVSEVLAGRLGAGDTLTAVLGVLPAVAGWFAATRGGLGVDWSAEPPDAAGYAALAIGHPGARDHALDHGSTYWELLLTPGEQVPVPPLSHLPSMAKLLNPELPVRLPRAAAVYLLPFVDPDDPTWSEMVMAAVADAMDGERWLALAIAARAVLHLPEQSRAEAVGIAERRYPKAAARLAAWSTDAWAYRPRAELALVHPQADRLVRFAMSAPPTAVTRLCHDLLDGLEPGRGPVDTLPPMMSAVREWPQPRTRWTGPYEADSRITGVHETPHPPARPARHLTVFVARPGADRPVAARPLPALTPHEVVLRVGTPDIRSLLAVDPGAVLPEEYLPNEDLHLDVALAVDEHVTSARLHLPAATDSDWLRLRLPSLEDGLHTAHVGLYYRAALVLHAQLTLPVGGSSGVGPSARVTHRLSRSLTDLWYLADRSAGIAVLPNRNDATAAVLVNGLHAGPRSGRAEGNRIDKAARLVRHALFDAHLVVEGTEVRTRYDTAHRKDPVLLRHDLGRLAAVGQRLYGAFVGDPYVRAALADRLRDEAAARGRPAVLQIVGGDDRNEPVPWAAVYDLPLAGDPSTYDACPSLDGPVPRTGAGEPPARCPFEDQHRGPDGAWLLNQLCPWGFWGFSTLVEHPPRLSRRDVERVVGVGTPIRYLLADGPDLDDLLRRTHLRRVRERLDGDTGHHVTHLEAPRRDALAAALTAEPDVVYLYCHSGRSADADPGPADPYLHFAERVTPTDIDGWSRSTVRLRWLDRHPLVVINGCHTVEHLSGSLTDFVTAFTDWAGGSGVIGTEITIAQPVASWAMELFLDALATHPVGPAVRLMRWGMLDRGNVMGLAYTPYCLADLTIRPTEGVTP